LYVAVELWLSGALASAGDNEALCEAKGSFTPDAFRCVTMRRAVSAEVVRHRTASGVSEL